MFKLLFCLLNNLFYELNFLVLKDSFYFLHLI